jgi:hypothetical protein
MEPAQLAELEHRGWTVVRGIVPDRGLTSQARQLVDTIIGGSDGLEQVAAARGQPGPWPRPGETRPIITSSAFKHTINPPIDDRAFGHAGLLAKLLLPMVRLNRQLLRCGPADEAAAGEGGGDQSAGGLKLLQQFLRRTDVGPPPHPGCTGGPPPNAWHLDQAYLPQHFAARPKQMFYHTILALTDVKRDGGAFFASPSSLARARSLTQQLEPAEASRYLRHADETRTHLRQVRACQSVAAANRSPRKSISPVHILFRWARQWTDARAVVGIAGDHAAADHIGCGVCGIWRGRSAGAGSDATALRLSERRCHPVSVRALHHAVSRECGRGDARRHQGQGRGGTACQVP